MPENATELLERQVGAGSVAEAAEAEVSDITDAEAGEVVAADLLVEEISIDGMCGVY
jgi:mycofactocin precursor